MTKVCWWYFAFLLLVGCSGAIHIENDILGSRHHNGDKYFTHGTKFSYFPEQENDIEKETYSIGQNIYTPSIRYTRAEFVKDTLEKDRPYAGWLYGEYRRSKAKSDTLTDTIGAQIGCSGACAFARQTQQETHRILGQSIPLWDTDYTLRQEWGVILEAERQYLLKRWEYADAKVHGNLKAGNIVDSAGIGFSFRNGYNLDRFQPEPIIFKTVRVIPDYTAYFFIEGEQRAVVFNHFLEGSLFHSEPHTVSPERFVQELNAGFTVGYKQFRLTYRYTVFSNEWKERNGSFAFGGLDLKW